MPVTLFNHTLKPTQTNPHPQILSREFRAKIATLAPKGRRQRRKELQQLLHRQQSELRKLRQSRHRGCGPGARGITNRPVATGEPPSPTEPVSGSPTGPKIQKLTKVGILALQTMSGCQSARASDAFLAILHQHEFLEWKMFENPDIFFARASNGLATRKS